MNSLVQILLCFEGTIWLSV